MAIMQVTRMDGQSLTANVSFWGMAGDKVWVEVTSGSGVVERVPVAETIDEIECMFLGLTKDGG
ncbi:hypothetical protein [Caulobacter sp. LARHSG274]